MLVIDSGHLYFVDTLTSDSNPLYLSDVLSCLKDSEFADANFDANALSAELETINQQLDHLNATAEPSSAKLKVKIRLCAYANASIDIVVDSENMSATATVIVGSGRSMTENEIKKACLKTNIRYGLKVSLVKRLIDQVNQAKVGATIEQLIVQGKPATPGKDAFIKPLVTLFSQDLRRHKRYDDGRFDLRDLGEIHTVDVGQVVAEKVPATAGLEGINVFGETIATTDGVDIPLIPTEGVEINPDNANQLIACKKGLLRMVDGAVVVDDVLVLEQVDAKTGHVKFKGSLIVKGDVTPDMHIQATGDVTIGGFVESASIKCSGHLVIAGGCSGRILNEEELVNDYAKARNARYSCSLVSGADIHVAFTNQCHLVAKKHIQVEKHLIHSHVTADSVHVGAGERPSGKILGSFFYLSHRLEAGFIGSESNVHVDIDMNRGYQPIHNKILEVKSVIQKITKKKQQISDKTSAPPKQQRHAPDFIDKQLTVVDNHLRKYQQLYSALQQRRQSYLQALQIKANSKLMSHVKFQFAAHAFITKEQHGPSLVTLSEDKISIVAG